MFSEDLGLEERSVRGSLVVGLSDKDMRLLDLFEGSVSTGPLTRGTMAAHVLVGICTRTGSCPPTRTRGRSRRHRGDGGGAERPSPGARTKQACKSSGSEHIRVVQSAVHVATEIVGI